VIGLLIANDDVEPHAHGVPEPAQGLDIRHAAAQFDAREGGLADSRSRGYFLLGEVPLARLRAAHLIQVPGETLPAELLAIKLRTRMRRLQDSTGLHILVVTLRCEHTCRYCQVSRQSAAKNVFDMTEETARRALELAFRSPSPQLKIEFQGGEPLLNFPLVRWITAEANRMNKEHGKDLAFVIATNLALLDEEILDFCAQEQVHISTSLDGPQDLHNGNRRRPGQDSWH
jgi:sulfatase maturation enzyme AslB (radical SAM superfamily)